MRICLLLGILVVFFACINAQRTALAKRDTTWTRCANITTAFGQTQACVSFVITNDCDGVMSLTVGDITLYEKIITVDIPPKVTVQYQGCALSVNLVDINNAEGHFCVQLQVTCGGIPLETYSLGCVTDTRLMNCVGCPGNCNNNGACSNGVCTCYQGWTGDDCSEHAPLYEKCATLSGLDLDMCVRVRFGNCKVGYSFLVNNLTIAAFYDDANQLVHDPNHQDCFNYLGCDLCLKTLNFQGSATKVSACLKMDITCILKFEQDYGCFEQLGNFQWPCYDCPGNCNSNGNCQENGTCVCKEGYFGEACQFLRCPYDCNGHGLCSQGTCQCFSGYAQPYCTAAPTAPPSPSVGPGPSPSPHHHHSDHDGEKKKVIIGVVVSVALVALIIGGIVFWYFRVRKPQGDQPNFQRMVINTEDEDFVN